MLICIGALAMGASVARSQPAAALPSSQAQLHTLYDNGQYRPCLLQIQAALGLGGKAGAQYDPFDLHQLQGECLLRLHEMPEAFTAFAAAEKSPNPAQVAQARAIAFLIPHSPNLQYTPKAAGAAKLDIVDPAVRSKAMLALLEDSKATVQRAIDQAVGEPNLVHLMPLFPQVADVHALEFAATGADAQTGPMLDAISAHGVELVSADLATRDQNLGDLEALSNQDVVVGYDDEGDAMTLRRGLTPDEYRGLQALIGYLGNVYSAAEQGRTTDASCGHDGGPWADLAGQSRAMAVHAQAVLNIK